MSRQYRACSGEDRTSLYDEITNKIIAELEAGRVPWVQPWGTAAAKPPLAMPQSAATGRRYSGRKGLGSSANTTASSLLARSGRWLSGRGSSCRTATPS